LRQAWRKYRINPGNVGKVSKHVRNSRDDRKAIRLRQAVRIGVNWGSLDQDLLGA